MRPPRCVPFNKRIKHVQMLIVPWFRDTWNQIVFLLLCLRARHIKRNIKTHNTVRVWEQKDVREKEKLIVERGRQRVWEQSQPKSYTNNIDWWRFHSCVVFIYFFIHWSLLKLPLSLPAIRSMSLMCLISLQLKTRVIFDVCIEKQQTTTD